MNELLINEMFESAMSYLDIFVSTGVQPAISDSNMQGLFMSLADTYIQFCIEKEEHFMDACMGMYENLLSSRESILLFVRKQQNSSDLFKKIFERFLDGYDIFETPETLEYFRNHYIDQDAVKQDIGRIYGRTPNI